MTSNARKNLAYCLGIAGFILQIGAGILSDEAKKMPPPAMALAFLGFLLLAAGLFILARVKGYPGYYCLISVFSIIGLIALSTAPNKEPAQDSTPYPPLARGQEPSDYKSIPWHRRSEGMSTLLGVGIFMPPVLLVAVFVCATGKIYANKKDSDGNLVVWSKANTYAAVGLLLFWVAYGVLLATGIVELPSSQ